MRLELDILAVIGLDGDRAEDIVHDELAGFSRIGELEGLDDVLRLEGLHVVIAVPGPLRRADGQDGRERQDERTGDDGDAGCSLHGVPQTVICFRPCSALRLDFRRELAGIDELLERFDRPRLPHLDQEIDERDLDEGIALDRQGLDQALAHAGPVAEEIEGVHGGQPDVGIGIAVDRLEERGERRAVRVLDLGAVADALDAVRGGGLAEQGQGDLLAHVLDLAGEGRDTARRLGARRS